VLHSQHAVSLTRLLKEPAGQASQLLVAAFQMCPCSHIHDVTDVWLYANDREKGGHLVQSSSPRLGL
jgi:hypothetical protein